MKIHKILSGLMAVVMTTGLSLSAAEMSDHLIATVAEQPVVISEVIAAAPAVLAPVITEATTVLAPVITEAPVVTALTWKGRASAGLGSFWSGLKAAPSQMWSGLKATPGYVKSGYVAAKTFAFANPYYVAGGCALTLAAIAALVVYKKRAANKKANLESLQALSDKARTEMLNADKNKPQTTVTPNTEIWVECFCKKNQCLTSKKHYAPGNSFGRPGLDRNNVKASECTSNIEVIKEGIGLRYVGGRLVKHGNDQVDLFCDDCANRYANAGF